MQGRIEEATAEYQACTFANVDNPMPYYKLGVALEKTGRIDEAAAEYRKALELDPTFDAALLGLQRVEKWQLGKH